MTPQEFGELIRFQREAKGLDMEQLASRFKLSVSTLRAIEEGSMDRMPHVVYARGFVRSYAQAVGVSPEDLEAGIEALFPRDAFDDAPATRSRISKPPRPRGRGGDKLVALLLIVVVVVLPLVGGWFVFSKYGDQIMEMIKKPLSATSSPTSGSASARAQLPVEQVEAVIPETPEPLTQAMPDVVDAPAQENESAPQSADDALPTEQAVQEAPVPAPTANVLPVEGKQVLIKAREECWIQVMVDGAGSRSFTLFPGETSALPYKHKITLVLGNMGGVDITHNGKPYSVTGRRSEKRTLVFQ